MAFPRLNAFGFWVFFFSGLFLYFSYIVRRASTTLEPLQMSGGLLIRP
jgi:heme/copper-type cytochrome/quinol oxidase subunit 1